MDSNLLKCWVDVSCFWGSSDNTFSLCSRICWGVASVTFMTGSADLPPLKVLSSKVGI